jgi:hypothetical protein
MLGTQASSRKRPQAVQSSRCSSGAFSNFALFVAGVQQNMLIFNSA